MQIQMQIQIQTTTALPNYSSALMKHSATNTSAQRNENKNLNYPSTNRLKCKVCSRAKCKKNANDQSAHLAFT